MNNIAEYVLCRDNIFYFMEKYLKLELRGYQIDALVRYEDPKRQNVLNILGHRGCGISTINAVYLLWRGLFYPNEKLLWVLPNYDTIRTEQSLIMRLYTTFTSNWPDDAKTYKINVTSMGRIIFNNDSMIKMIQPDPVKVKGWSFNNTIIDSTIKETIEFYENSVPNLGKLIITNSEIPVSSYFDDFGEVHKYPWYCNGNRSLEWYIETLNSLGKPTFNRWYGCTRGFRDD